MNLLDVVYVGVAGATSPWWVRKARGGWRQRFAMDLPELPAKRAGVPRILLHAVSVGEAAALRSLVPMLVERGAEVIVSCTTDTGLKRAGELYADTAAVVRFPLDASWAVERFLGSVQPDAVGLVELELWPNFLRSCARRGVPVAVINGRLSERSFGGYQKIRRWMRPSFAGLSRAMVQDEAYAQRFIAMGTPAERVEVTGSMKFDAASLADRVDGQEALAADLGVDPLKPLVVGGSTGPGEEALLHEACVEASRVVGQDVQLLCAPRRPERFDEAAAALPGCVRRSASGVGERVSGQSSASGRFLLDTIGELAKAYALADVVVVGRSFPSAGPGGSKRGLGGSDPIEPIALGRAVVYGPDCANFRDVVGGFERAGGLVVADSREGLAGVLWTLLGDSAAARAMAERGRGWVEQQRGASARHADRLLELAGVGGAGG